MIDPTKIWVSEHSHRQNCFHIHTLADALQKNITAVVKGYPVDYIPFAISSDMETADEICSRMRKLIKANSRKMEEAISDDECDTFLP